MTQRIKIKPLSVNQAWQGMRFKTQAYKNFERALLLQLKPNKVSGLTLELHLVFGFSNKNSDLSNPLKLVEDILQKKYGFNDNKIYAINLKKQIVPKGHEYIEFTLKSSIGTTSTNISSQ